MVLNAADTYNIATSCFDKCANICMQLGDMLPIYHRTRCFGVEDDV